MKRTLFLLIATVVALSGARSQSLWDASHPNHLFSFGVRAGVNFASTDMDYATSSRTGIHAGVNVDWNIVKSLALSTGIMYVEKGFQGMYGKSNAHVMQVPLLVSYRVMTPTGVWFHLNVGPYVSYGIGGKTNYHPQDQTYSFSFDQDTYGKKGFMKYWDAGLQVELNVQLGHTLLGVGYELGLTDYAKVYGQFHNRNVLMTVGYIF